MGTKPWAVGLYRGIERQAAECSGRKNKANNSKRVSDSSLRNKK